MYIGPDPPSFSRQDFIRDYIEEFTVLTLVSIGWGPFNYPMWSGTLLLPNDEPNTSSIGGGGGAGGTIILPKQGYKVVF